MYVKETVTQAIFFPENFKAGAFARFWDLTLYSLGKLFKIFLEIEKQVRYRGLRKRQCSRVSLKLKPFKKHYGKSAYVSIFYILGSNIDLLTMKFGCHYIIFPLAYGVTVPY